jgi:FkbH-like protein
MKLIEALNFIQANPSGGEPWPVWLCVGFTPLHLETFFKAHLIRLLPGRAVEVRTGLYGDLAGTLQKVAAGGAAAAAVVVEWPDLDPRLGIRQIADWDPESLPGIIAEAKRRLGQLEALASQAAAQCPVAVSLPTLALPPAAYTAPQQASVLELELQAAVIETGLKLTAAGVRVVSAMELNRGTTLAQRHDPRAELSAGFPYQLGHASEMAGALAGILARPTPKKGLITDLDDTLWKGIVGDDGPEAVSWDFDHHSSVHGIYQQTIRSLAKTGVFVGVASKNNREPVEAALARQDLIVPPNDLFPVELGWGPKPDSVARILEAWNIAADAVVFVDDNPMELEHVGQAHPGIECLRFPTNDPAGVLGLCRKLRELFGKSAIGEEDRIRAASRRSAIELEREAPADNEEFLKGLAGVVVYSDGKQEGDGRALELINKTNQFNFNGRRFGEAEWKTYIRDPDTRVLVADYREKYGPLGKIAVVAGRLEAGRFAVDVWVMSCRAFSRRIEFHSLLELFERFQVEEVQVAFQPTARNGPARDFLVSVMPQPPAAGNVCITRAEFEAKCPLLYMNRAMELVND